MRVLVIVTLATVPLLASCKSFTTVCGGVGAPDVAVIVVDSLTSVPGAAGATLLTYDLDHGGVRVDSVVGRTDTEEIWGAIDRRGRFSVVVRKNGYRDWTKPEVTVEDGCPAIKTARLTARLARP